MQNKLRIVLLGFVSIAISFVITGICWSWCIDSIRFWMLAGPLLFSELLIVLCLGGFIFNRNDAEVPLVTAQLAVPWIYFVFTLIMLLAAPSSLTAIFVLQLLGLFVALIVTFFTMMIGSSIERNDAIHAAAVAPRRNMRIQMVNINALAERSFSGNQELMALLAKCADAVRFAADTPASAVGADDEAMQELAALEASVAAGDSGNVAAAAERLLTAMKKREEIIKISR